MHACVSSTRHRPGYLLVEMICVIAVLSVVAGLAVALMVSGRRKLEGAMLAIERKGQLSRAFLQLEGDIRKAHAAKRIDGALVLSMPGSGEVRWLVKDGQLARSEGKRVHAWRPQITGWRVGVDSRQPGSAFVETSCRLRAGRPGHGLTLYVAARTRTSGSRK